MALTAKQESFAQAVVSGLSQSDAYRKAYDASKMKAETIANNAYKLMSDNDVATRVATLRESLASKGLWTREKSVQALAAIADGGEAKANEIVAAIKELNLMHGFNAPSKVEVTGSMIHRIERVIIDPKD